MATQIPKNQNNSPVSFLEAPGPLPELKADYLRMGDPTEYRFAQKYYPGGWEAWLILQENPEAMGMIGKWREELAAKLSSESLARIIEAAQGETRDALAANRYLYETLRRENNKVGRPSKEAIAKQASFLFEDDKKREEAYRRIFDAKEKEAQEPLQ